MARVAGLPRGSCSGCRGEERKAVELTSDVGEAGLGLSSIFRSKFNTACVLI